MSNGRRYNNKRKEMYFLEFSCKIGAAVKLPLAYLGGIKSLANAEQAIAKRFECGVLARALLHDPALAVKCRVAN
jgi:2,4-dienoyl-CoA reductase-like NADH-dependent reductase (Old Yellow Enzyme family)